MNIIVGCDFHSRFQLLVVHDMTSQSRREVRLEHDDRGQVASFYRQLPPGSLLLIESTAFTHWFLDLVADMPLRVKMGDAGRLAAMRPKKVKTDRRDAAHLVDMYLQGAFPEIALPTAAQRELRHLLLHRDRLVRMRTRLKNGLHWLAMNHGLNRKSGLFTARKKTATAKVAVARKLSERLYWMCRRGVGYPEVVR